jgi:hypothetical protein
MPRPRNEPRFDPYATLAALERERVTYIVIGAFARVIHGADEITRGIDLTPSTREENLRRLDLALGSINARRLDGREPSLQSSDLDAERVVELRSDAGEVKIVPFPEGSRGYDDLRRDVSHEPIGRGLRPPFASPDDLARMLSALNREQDIPKLIMMRRLIELEHGISHGLSIER